MAVFWLAVAATAALLISVIYKIFFFSFKPWDKKNYPPVAGTVFHQLLNFDRLQDFQTNISHKHKTFRLLAPFCNYVYTVDPANIEYILKTNFANYGKGDTNHDILKDLFGDGIFAVDGEKWRQQRKLASFEFSTKILRDCSSLVFKRNAIRLSEILVDTAKSGKMIDIQDLFMKSTLDSIFEVGFGAELDTLSGASKEGRTFAKAFDETSIQILRRYVDVFWKIQRFLNIGSEAVMKKNVKLLDNFIYDLIEKKIREMQDLKDDFVKKGDILSRFLIERERDPTKMSCQYLRDIILNFVIAGRDTTAGTLSWFFYMLCKHQKIQEKISEEVRTAMGVIDSTPPISEVSGKLTEEALSKMQYLHAALTETLRLYPAVPLNVKLCLSDDVLPDGSAIMKGDMVNYQPYAMGRMKALWGEDAETFRPERWLKNGVFQPESPFKFTAFQAGPRICLGKEFAYRQMKIFAATLLCFFRFKMWDENKPVNYKSMITLQINGGLPLRVLSR